MVRLATVLLAVAFLIPTTASADWKPNFKFGKLELHPYAKLTDSYDSNIYLQSKDSQQVFGSWITDSTLGLGLKFPVTDMHQLQAAYNFQWLAYDKHPSRNNTANHIVKAAYKYKGPMGITGKLYDNYVNTTDPASSELVDRETRWQNSAGMSVDYAPKDGKLFLELSGMHVRHKYVGLTLDDLLGRYEATFGTRIGYKVFPKTRVYLGYSRKLVHYTADQYTASVSTAAGSSNSFTFDAKNNKSHDAKFGIEGKLAPKLKGQVETGLTYREYDGPATDQSGTVPTITKISRNWTVGTNLTYNPLERTELKLRFTRTLEESVYQSSRFYIHNLVALNLKHKFPYKLTGRAGLSWGVDKYPESTPGGRERDDLYVQSVGVDYDIQKWLQVGLDYTHRERNSTDTASYNYEDHITALGVKAMF